MIGVWILLCHNLVPSEAMRDTLLFPKAKISRVELSIKAHISGAFKLVERITLPSAAFITEISPDREAVTALFESNERKTELRGSLKLTFHSSWQDNLREDKPDLFCWLFDKKSFNRAPLIKFKLFFFDFNFFGFRRCFRFSFFIFTGTEMLLNFSV